jgi:hypothetical protein
MGTTHVGSGVHYVSDKSDNGIRVSQRAGFCIHVLLSSKLASLPLTHPIILFLSQTHACMHASWALLSLLEFYTLLIILRGQGI